MSFLADLKPHIKELRYRLIVSCASIILLSLFCFIFWESLLNVLIAPVENLGLKLISIEVQEKFFVALKVSIFTALILSLPIIFAQIWLFVSPALYDNEKKMVVPFALFSTAMFVLGIVFCYFIVLPYGLEFLLNFGASIAEPTISIAKYISFISKVLFGFGIAFELPVFCAVLGFMGLIDDKSLIKFFKYAIVIIFALSAVLTPPDIFTQFLMSGPMILLYGFSVLILKFIKKNQ
ncbi:MAG: Twin-arginine translocation protein TatC [uncultured Campylobacterales bacterium]|uniref:Sec-independent protein translocase protein TatC n=1 Tax=uncultured Campylobacterales bacterium TaxID=352960 RepID=A0A6S6SS07_9BACT|nr:MAG: Twin-arginine translocation protein TatC [uncultured Campylobacterales bacterium]